MITEERKRYLIELTHLLIDELIESHKDELNGFIKPFIHFNLTGKDAGHAIGYHTINLNLELFHYNENAFLFDTIPHELAHAVTRWIYGMNRKLVKPHGYQWQSVMIMFGYEPKRCHDMDTSQTRTRKRYRHPRPHIYLCPNQYCKKVYHVTSLIHKRTASGKRASICSLCKTKVIYQGEKSA